MISPRTKHAQVTPFNAPAAKSVAKSADYAGPTPGFVEQVYCIRPLAGKDGRTLIALQNKARDRAHRAAATHCGDHFPTLQGRAFFMARRDIPSRLAWGAGVATYSPRSSSPPPAPNESPFH